MSSSAINTYMNYELYKLFTPEQFEQSKVSDLLPIKCMKCGTTTLRRKSSIRDSIRRKFKFFCSSTCFGVNNITSQSYTCSNCKKTILRRLCTTKTKNLFCSKSCAATYNNAHKDHGYRRSKLESYIEEQLKKEFPSLDIHFNSKKAINSELDIYIPALRMAFELNGIFHYEPIYSQDQFIRIQNNDKQKTKLCLDAGIELVTIDTSKQINFTELTSQKYYSIIKELIELNLNRALSVQTSATT